MRIHTLLEYRWNDAGELVLVREEGFDYEGPVAHCKGVSAGMQNAADSQKALAQQQSKFYSTLQSQQAQQFGAQSGILQSLQKAWQPILEKGPGQFGFTPAETAALRTQAGEGTGREYAKAQRSLEGNLATRGGGNSVIPAGADEQLRATLAQAGAESSSDKQLGITQAGYQEGRNLFQSATTALGGVAGMYNPAGFANSATSAGNSAMSGAEGVFSTEDKLNTIRQQSSPWGAIGGLAGGALGTILGGPMGGKIGASLGGMLGGGGSGAGSSIFGGGGNSWGGLFGGNTPNLPPNDPSICWVAAELYGGWTAPETLRIRQYLLSPSAPERVKQFTKLYAEKGREWAREIQHNLVARAKFRKLFDHFLAEATA